MVRRTHPHAGPLGKGTVRAVCVGACVRVHSFPAWCLRKLEEGVGGPGTRVICSCEQLWDSNPGHQERQPVSSATEDLSRKLSAGMASSPVRT